MPLPSAHEVEACPKCGSRTGFYIRSRVSGLVQINYSFDGSGSDNQDMYTQLNHNDQKFAYCQQCESKIGRWDDKSKSIVSTRVCF